MRTLCLIAIIMPALLSAAARSEVSEVHVQGEMRRMFTQHDIGPNVPLIQLTNHPHAYALGPLAGLQGEVTVVDGQVLVSRVKSRQQWVMPDPNVKAVFLVYASVPEWRSTQLPASITTEKDLADFLEKLLPGNTRSAFMVRGTALSAQYHIQNFQGNPAELTHEKHDRAKVFYQMVNTPVELIGFFSNREGDGGAFVHRGQTTHIHVVSQNRKQMGHLESIRLAAGAELLLPKR